MARVSLSGPNSGEAVVMAAPTSHAPTVHSRKPRTGGGDGPPKKMIADESDGGAKVLNGSFDVESMPCRARAAAASASADMRQSRTRFSSWTRRRRLVLLCSGGGARTA